MLLFVGKFCKSLLIGKVKRREVIEKIEKRCVYMYVHVEKSNWTEDSFWVFCNWAFLFILSFYLI